MASSIASENVSYSAPDETKAHTMRIMLSLVFSFSFRCSCSICIRNCGKLGNILISFSF